MFAKNRFQLLKILPSYVTGFCLRYLICILKLLNLFPKDYLFTPGAATTIEKYGHRSKPTVYHLSHLEIIFQFTEIYRRRTNLLLDQD